MKHRHALSLTAALLLAACGGGDNPLDNPPSVANPAASACPSSTSSAAYSRCWTPRCA
jgi:hypothetical protein